MEPAPSNLRSNLRKKAEFTIELITTLILDGISVLFILGILYILNKAIICMGMAEENIIGLILEYSHVATLIIFLFFTIIHISSFLKDQVNGK